MILEVVFLGIKQLMKKTLIKSADNFVIYQVLKAEMQISHGVVVIL